MSDSPSTNLPARAGLPSLIVRVYGWFDRPEGRTLRLLLFGAIVAALGTFELSRVHPAPWVLQGGRLNMLDWTLAVLDQGGPILTMVAPGTNQLSAAGASDDQGLYLIVPWLAHAFGSEDPLNVLRWLALLSFAIPIALYPWLMRALSGSTLAGLASPFLLLIGLWLLPLSDIYWVGVWVIVGLLPIVLLLDRRWPRGGLFVLLGLLVLASVASSIRGSAGLPILLTAALVVVRRPWTVWLRGGAVMLCLLAYLSFNSFGMEAARTQRDRELDGRELAGADVKSHPFWHTAYVGLGYLPNKWDIHYQDAIGYRDALRINPRVLSLGPTYNRILRDRYFEILKEDPGFAFRDYGAKLLVTLRAASPGLIALAIVGPWLLLIDRRRSRWRRDALLIGIAAALTLTSPFLATPYAAYLMPWLSAVMLASILAFSAVLGDWRAALAYARSLRPMELVRGSQRAVGRSVVAALAVLVVILAVVPGIQRKAQDWNAKPAPPVETPKDPIP